MALALGHCPLESGRRSPRRPCGPRPARRPLGFSLLLLSPRFGPWDRLQAQQWQVASPPCPVGLSPTSAHLSGPAQRTPPLGSLPGVPRAEVAPHSTLLSVPAFLQPHSSAVLFCASCSPCEPLKDRAWVLVTLIPSYVLEWPWNVGRTGSILPICTVGPRFWEPQVRVVSAVYVGRPLCTTLRAGRFPRGRRQGPAGSGGTAQACCGGGRGRTQVCSGRPLAQELARSRDHWKQEIG